VLRRKEEEREQLDAAGVMSTHADLAALRFSGHLRDVEAAQIKHHRARVRRQRIPVRLGGSGKRKEDKSDGKTR